MNPIVIMPSIRQPNLDYLEPLGDTPVLVIDDSDGNIPKDLAPHITVIDYAGRKAYMGKDEWLVPKKNPSCKNLGLFYAWKEGYDYAILLDDDCDLRVTPDYLDRIPIGKPDYHQITEDDSFWFNPMELLGEPTLWSRGFPYEHRAQSMPNFVRSQTERISLFNEGLWSGTPDINGLDKFVTDLEVTAERQCSQTVALRPGQMLPLSIMNVQIHRDLIPAFYQPPDYDLPDGYRIRRHDDVWSMMFLKTLMDLKRDTATVGQPIIWHRKEGDPLKEAISEHVTNLIQPHLYDVIKKASKYTSVSASYAYDAMLLGQYMQMRNHAPGIFRSIISDYAARIQAWSKLFMEPADE
jgi:hypothetical protein